MISWWTCALLKKNSIVSKIIEVSIETSYRIKLGINKVTYLGILVTAYDDEHSMEINMETMEKLH